MSAVVCRKRSTSIFEELEYITPSPSKKIRCSPGAASPTSGRKASQFFTLPIASGSVGDNSQLLNHLRSLFPTMEQQYLERALEASGNDLDSAIMSLNDLCLESSANRANGIEENGNVLPEGCLEIWAQFNILSCLHILQCVSGEESADDNIPKNGSDWVDLFVREMMSASDIDDARTRASRALEVFEKSIIARVNVEATQNFDKASMILKEQVDTLQRENSILKTAVAIQHQRQKDLDEKNQELPQLKQLVSQYQEQLSKLEVANYALAMHLRQAQQGYSIPGRFHPDIF